jgi:ubiquitin fusion degradation protein 1
LKCYSFAFANKKTLSEVGDKVILPASKLHDFENNRIPFPFTFQLLPLSSKDTNNNNAKITEATSTNENASKLEMTQTHCGVLDFTAPNETAYLPHHMMTKLNIDEGDAVLFRSVVLPQGSFAKFQPHSIQWIEIDEVERKRILESQLRKYQTLSLHDLVVIEHQNVTYFFTVLELKPSSAVCILDSDLEVDIEEPVDLQKIQIVALEWDKPAPFDLSSKNYFAFFSVHVDDVNTKLMIKMMPEEGTATFYVSTTRKYPSKSGFQWSSDDVNNGSLMNSIDGSKAVIIDQTDASFIVGSYYIGVYAIAGNRCKGTIVVTNYKNSAFQQTLKTIQTEPLEDSSQCPNCLKQIPKQSYTVHILQCAKRNWFCEQCHKIIPISDKQKHIQTMHTKLKCECGYEGEQDLFQLHKQYECRFRPFRCPYCESEIRWSDRGEHLEICGSRTTKCPHCDKICKRNELRLHEETAHQTQFSTHQQQE